MATTTCTRHPRVLPPLTLTADHGDLLAIAGPLRIARQAAMARALAPNQTMDTMSVWGGIGYVLGDVLHQIEAAGVRRASVWVEPPAPVLDQMITALDAEYRAALGRPHPLLDAAVWDLTRHLFTTLRQTRDLDTALARAITLWSPT